MRITMSTIYDQINTDLNRLTEKMAKTNASISSGKIYRRPDGPVALTHALSVRVALSETKQCERNITYGQAWVTATESALTQVEDRLMRAKTLAVQGANDSQNDQSRKAIAVEIKTLLDEIVALGNTKLAGRYVFAGTKTRGYEPGEAPFVLERDGSVNYLGNREDLVINVASGLQQKINLDGHTALVQSKAFETLDLLYDSLMANSRADVEVALADVDKSIEYLSLQVSQLGAQANTLFNKADMVNTLTLTNQERLSDIEDTDIVRAITDLKTQETSYQASLASASRVMGLSLVNYL